MKDFCIIGAGISGSIIAYLLKKKYSLQVIEKSKGVGGRSSNKRYNKLLSFDHGLQFISPKSKEFQSFILKYETKNILKKWTGLHINLCSNKEEIKNRFIGRFGNNDLGKFLLKKTEVIFSSEVKNINNFENYWEITLDNTKKIYSKNIILTCPFPQVKSLTKKYLNKKIKNLKVKMQPNITVMCAFKNSKNINISSIKFKDNVISWAANENSKKRFNSKLCLWTIQCNLNWSIKNINLYKKKKKSLIRLITKRFSKLTGLNEKNIIFSKIHGWKYAYNYQRTSIKSYWSRKYKLGICGDWFLGPKAENSWQSARDLFKKI